MCQECIQIEDQIKRENEEFEREEEMTEQEAVNQIVEAKFNTIPPRRELTWEEEQVILNALFWHKNDRANGLDQEIAKNLFDWFTSIQNSGGPIVITVNRREDW